MYTDELAHATLEQRRRDAAQIEREVRAERALRRGATPRGLPSRDPGRDLPIISSVARALKTASAS